MYKKKMNCLGHLSSLPKVFCHSETTSLGPNKQLVEVAAVFENYFFHAFIKPTIKMDPNASRKNGLYTSSRPFYHGKNRAHYELEFRDGTRIRDAISFPEFIYRFRNFLQNIQKNLDCDNLVLVGLNAASFSAELLNRHLGLGSEFVFQDAQETLRDVRCQQGNHELQKGNFGYLRQKLSERGVEICEDFLPMEKAVIIEQIFEQFHLQSQEVFWKGGRPKSSFFQMEGPRIKWIHE